MLGIFRQFKKTRAVNHNEKIEEKRTQSDGFADLTEVEKEKRLEAEADRFSKDFRKVMEELAHE